MKIAIAFLVTGKYKIGLDVLLHSLDRHNSLNEIDKILITDDIEKYNDLKIINVDGKIYKDVIKPNPKWAKTFYKFEIFKMYDYDRVIFLDCDMLCVGDISYLFSSEINKYDLCGVRSSDYGRSKQINSGLLVVNKSLLNENTYKDLIKISKKKSFHDGGDEGIINYYLHSRNVKLFYLPIKYNLLSRNPKLNKRSWDEMKDDTSLIHFVGTKPWEGGIRHNFLTRLWFDEYKFSLKNA